MNKSDICFIRARAKNDYVFEGIKNMGYQIMIPYKDYNLLLRCLREGWFKIKFLNKSVWFNPQIKQINAKLIIVKDPLIVPELLQWIKLKHPHNKIILDYDNRVNNSINPNSIQDNIAEKWSYDEDDCRQYNMKKKPSSYLDIYKVERKSKPVYDVVYLGRDKGRVEELIRLKEKFEKLGLHVCFHICSGRRYQRFQKKIYKPFMPYGDYLKLIGKTRAILNIMPENQISLTQREMEAIFHEVKCITNNKAIKQFELYHSSRYFVLGEDDLSTLSAFLKMPFLKVQEEQLKKYYFDNTIEKFLTI